MQQRKWVSVLAAGAMLSTMLAGCMEKHGELGNRNIRSQSVKYDMNGNRILNTRFANDQMNEMNRADGHRLNSNNLVGLHKNYRLEMSQAMSDRITGLNGVGKAYVMLTDDNAYVALSVRNANRGPNAMSYYAPTTISRTQQAHMRSHNMTTYNTHAYTSKNKTTRASSIATPNMHLRRSTTGAGIIRAKSLTARPLNGKSMTAQSLKSKSATGVRPIRVTASNVRRAKSVNAKSFGHMSSSFHNVSNGVRNMSLSLSTNHMLAARYPNGMTTNRTARGLTGLSTGTTNTHLYGGRSNEGRGLYNGTMNAGTNMARGTGNAVGDLARGTANVGTDIVRGTGNAVGDLARGTANVGADIVRGTGNAIGDLARGTANAGTDMTRGTGNVGTDIARGTGNAVGDLARGTANVGSDVLRGTGNAVGDVARGTANVGTDVLRGTANAGSDVLRGTGNVGNDLARGTANVGRDIGRGFRNLAEDTADLLTGTPRDATRGTTTGTTTGYGYNGTYFGTSNLSRNTTDLSRSITPFAVNRTAGSGDVSTELKAEIDRLVKQMSPQIKNVYISADPEFVDRMASYMADVQKGSTIQPYIAEFNAMVDRIFPVRPRT